MQSFIAQFNFWICILFTICYAYQMLYIPIGIFFREKKYTAAKNCKYAVIVAARNEESVIGNLLESLKQQDYDMSLVDLYVIADNCTDNTANVARSHGAIVVERENKIEVGKGYALDYLFTHLQEEKIAYDGYFVFDADNLVMPNYITEMNKVFSNGNKVVTSYRNTKNYGDSWITACNGLYFLRECRFLNNSRNIIKSGASVSGTGFVVSHDVIYDFGGWKYFLLTEDVQFTVECALRGIRIAYAYNAVFFDEQPKSFMQSWYQRLRWVKGGYQVLMTYGTRLLKKSRKSFYCFDILMSLLPIVFINFLLIIANTFFFVYGLATVKVNPGLSAATLLSLFDTAKGLFATLYIIGGFTLVFEWKRIVAPWYKKLLYFITFPVFMATYVAIAVVAVFSKVSWRPIQHTSTASIHDLSNP